MLGTDRGNRQYLARHRDAESNSYNRRIMDRPEAVSYRDGEREFTSGLTSGPTTPRGNALLSFLSVTPTHFGCTGVITDASESTHF